MLSSGVWWSRVSCASPWGSPDRGNGPPFHPDVSHPESSPPTFHPDVSHPESSPPSFHPDILHPALDAGWERRAFQLPRSDISGSSNSAYPESIRGRQFRFPGQLGLSDACDSPDPFSPTIKKQTLIILTTKSPFCIVQRNFSWSFLIFPTDFLRYFALDIWCLNPQTLLIIHLS